MARSQAALHPSASVRALVGLFLTAFGLAPGIPSFAQDVKPSATVSASEFVLRLKEGRSEFYQGETIRIELAYFSRSPSLADAKESNHSHKWLVFEEFNLDPLDGVVDPMLDFLASIGGWSGPPPRWVQPVEENGQPVTTELNPWFRFEKPGKYRLYLTARVSSSRYGFAGDDGEGGKPPSVTSNTVEFEVLPTDSAWSAQELGKALRLIESTMDFQKQLEGCRILRFLGTEAAASQIIRHYADEAVCGSEFRNGLFESPHREFVVQEMQEGLAAPNQPVSADYLRTLATLSTYLAHPELLPQPSGQFQSAAMGGPLAGRYQLVEAEQGRFVEALVDHLADKSGRARAPSVQAVFDSPLAGKATLLPSGASALLPRLREELATVFLDLPPGDQDTLLRLRWEKVASPAMLPVLRSIYESTKPDWGEPLRDLALRRIVELAPEEGRALILAEVRSAHPRAGIEALKLLPEKELPDLDGTLAENLEASGGQDENIIELIARYSTPAIFPRVLGVTESRVGNMPCEPQSALLAYFLRSDATVGHEMVEKALASRERTGCYVWLLGEVARHHMDPQLEEIALAHLDDVNLAVASAAAGMLGRYGSADAEQALLQHLERWHAAWQDREKELPDHAWGEGIPNSDQAVWEQSLLNALAQGQAWFAGFEKLRELKVLCVSKWTRRQADNLLAEASARPLIGVNAFDDATIMSTVAQYQLDSMEALKQKLAQFPKGTVFTIQLNGSNPEEMKRIARELKSLAEDHGMRIGASRFWAGMPESPDPSAPDP